VFFAVKPAKREDYTKDAQALWFDCPKCGDSVPPHWDRNGQQMAQWWPGGPICAQDLIEEAANGLVAADA